MSRRKREGWLVHTDRSHFRSLTFSAVNATYVYMSIWELCKRANVETEISDINIKPRTIAITQSHQITLIYIFVFSEVCDLIFARWSISLRALFRPRNRLSLTFLNHAPFFSLFSRQAGGPQGNVDARMDFDESNVPRMEKAQPLLRAVSTAYEDM